MQTFTRTAFLRWPLPAVLLLLLLLTSAAAWAQPTVTGFSPASGAAGSTVTVTGTGFSNVTSVRFGELSATFSVLSTTQLTAVVPRAASTQPIIVTTTAGSEISPTAFAVTRNASLTYTLAANNFGGINVGTNAAPAVGDLDRDGLLDLLVGRADGTIARYEQSSPNATTFNSLGLLTAGGVTIDRGTEATVAIVDTDSDGKFNVLLGGADGYVYDYEQTAVGSTTFMFISDFVGQITTTSDSAPSVTNLDGDGRLDLVTGKGDGIVSFAEQDARNDPAFTVYDTNYQTVTASSAPFCVDLDGNGRVDVLIGVAGGNIYRYEQSAANNRTLTQRTSVFNSIDVGTNAKPCVTDLDGDGLLDLLIGRGDGTIDRYEQTPPPNTTPTDISLSNASVAENQPVNTAVGTLSTTDANAGDTFTYTFFSGGPDNGSFNIIGNTTLTTNRVFDFETKSSYTVRLRSTDQGGLFFVKDVTITVNNVSETPTITGFTPTSGEVGTNNVVITGTNFTSAGAVTVRFNGTTATTATANSNTQLTATVPAGATTGRLTVQNADGTATSGTDFTVTLPVVLATVTTAAPTGITPTSAVLGGEVTSQGNGTVTERGVVYVAGTGTPTTADTKVAIGSGLGTFAQTVTGLAAGTQYSVRAYALNGAGTAYGASTNTFVTATSPPVAGDDSYLVAEDSGPTTLAVLDNDSGTGLSITAVTQPANGSVTFTASSVAFTPAANFSGSTSFGYTITSSSGATDTGTVTVTVAAVNDAPVLTVPGPQSTPQGTAQVFSAANGNALSVADVDAGTGQLSVYITAGNGAVTLSTTAGLTLNGSNGSGSFGFSGTLANINAALNGLAFSPNNGFSGSAGLQLTVDDQGNTGSGGAKTDTKSVTIDVVAPANQAPVVMAPATQTALFNTNLTFNAANGNAVSVADADAGSGALSAVIAVGFGTATLSTTAGLTFTSGANGGGSFAFTGTLANINAALNGLVFRANSNYSGQASLQLTVNDQGNTGSGGAKSDSKTVAITVAPNQAPVLAAGSGSAAWLQGGGAVAVAPALTASDADSPNLFGATVSITGGFASGQDVLAFAAANGITASYAAGTGVLTLSGSASVANYQAALRSITYNNAAGTPTAGTRTISFVASDGSLNSAAVTRTVTVAVRPNTSIVSGPGTITNNSTVSFVFSSDQSPVLYETTGNPVFAFPSNGANSNFGPVPDGTYTLSVSARNTNNGLTDPTPATYTFTVDTQKPTPTISSAVASGATTTTSPIPFTITFSESVTSFALADIAVSGGTKGNFVAVSATQYTFELTPGAAGTYTVNVAAGVATDAATNQNVAATAYSVIYALPATAAPTVSFPTNGSTIASTTPTYTGTAVAGSIITVYVDNNSIGTTTIAAGGSTWSLTQPTDLAQGAHTVKVTATDGVGNVSAFSAVNTFTVDTVAPTVAVSSPAGASGSTTATTPVPFTITFNEPVANFVLTDITVSGGTAGSFATVSASQYTFTVAPAGAGTITVSVAAGVAQDRAGNNSAASPGPAFNLVYQPRPTISSLSAAAELPGMPVVVAGTGFTSASTATVGGVAASVTYTSATSLTVLVPATAAVGSSTIVVTTNGVSSASAPAFSVLKVYDAVANCLSTASYLTTGDGAWHYLLAGGQVVAALRDTDADLGTVSLDFLVTGTAGAVRQDARGRFYFDRNFHLTASGGTFVGSSVEVRFYGLRSELTRLTAADNAATLATLKATQYSGPNEDCDLGNNNSAAGESRVLLLAASTPSNGVTWFVAQATVADHFSEFYLSGSSTPLPVELVSFTAEVRGSAVALAWRTASEKNSARFEVERSLDGRTFASIGQVAAQGSKASPTNYTFQDSQFLTAAPRTAYYRLRQVDIDGTASYSPVRTVTAGGPAALALFPNPTHGGAATLTGAAPGTAVTVFDALGREVLATTADAAGTAALVPLRGLATGIYVVRAGSKTLRLTVD